MAIAHTNRKPRRQPHPLGFHTYPVLVSPKKAREDRAASEYPFQRPLRPYQVAYLRVLIEQGQADLQAKRYPIRGLRPGTTVTFAVFRDHNQRYCINGRHTLTALGETTGQAYPLQYEEYQVDTEEEVSCLYQSYDRNLARSWKDLYRADVYLQQQEFPPYVLEKLGGVTQLLATGFQAQSGFSGRTWAPLLKNPYIRFALMYDWLQELENFRAGLAGTTTSTRKLLYRSSVLAIAVVSYRFQSEKAHRFWPRLARDSGLTEGEPEWALLRYLRETPTRSVHPATYQRTVAAAWNLYFNRRPVTKLQPRLITQPILLLGTPHDGTTHYSYLDKNGGVCREPRAMAELEQSTETEASESA